MVIVLPSFVVLLIAIWLIKQLTPEDEPREKLGFIAGLIVFVIFVGGFFAFFWYGLGFKDDPQVREFWSDFF